MSAESDDAFTITVLAAPRGLSALVCLSGEIDMAACVALSHTTERLATVGPVTVIVDLATVTFACSTLPNFVAHLRRRLPVSSTLLLCRPIAGIRQLLQLTGIDQISTLRDDLPCRTSEARQLFRPIIATTQREAEQAA